MLLLFFVFNLKKYIEDPILGLLKIRNPYPIHNLSYHASSNAKVKDCTGKKILKTYQFNFSPCCSPPETYIDVVEPDEMAIYVKYLIIEN